MSALLIYRNTILAIYRPMFPFGKMAKCWKKTPVDKCRSYDNTRMVSLSWEH